MKYMPYASFYLDAIDFSKNEVEFVYWNRDLRNEDLSIYNKGIIFHEFREKMADSISKWNKIKHFFRYRNFVKKIINKQKFDFIISLHTFPGLLALDTLIKQYPKRYIFDYRDSTFESNRAFSLLVNKLALNAKAVFVSSDGFRKFLPDNEVETITSHNLLVDSLKHREDRKSHFVSSDRIRIAFWGFIRHFEHNKLIINKLANDNRFELHYYGREQETAIQLKKFVKEIDASNVVFHGEYNPIERYDFACKTDIIHNSYDDTNTLLAMGNKFYDGIIFRIPQLCMTGSYMAKRCEESGVGFGLNPSDEKYADKLYKLYHDLNKSKFDKACDRELDCILNEYVYGQKRLREILNP